VQLRATADDVQAYRSEPADFYARLRHSPLRAALVQMEMKQRLEKALHEY